MLIGDAAAWATHFTTFDERFLERIIAIWPACVAILPAQPDEDAITINVVDCLCKDAVVRRLCHWVEYQFEPTGMAPDGSKFSKGKIDVAALFDWERDRYLAYECKRLNVIHGGSRSSLATAYVKDGVMRFITEQYAEDLPLGCMLGYVMDGDLSFAQSRVKTAIGAHTPLMLQSGPDDLDPIATAPRIRTSHTRYSGALIEIRHAFLSFA